MLRQRDEKRSPLGGKAHAGRVLVVGDAVDELRAEPTCETPLEVFHVEPVLVHSDGDECRLEASERLDRAEVRRPSTTTRSPGSRNDLATSSSASMARS